MRTLHLAALIGAALSLAQAETMPLGELFWTGDADFACCISYAYNAPDGITAFYSAFRTNWITDGEASRNFTVSSAGEFVLSSEISGSLTSNSCGGGSCYSGPFPDALGELSGSVDIVGSGGIVFSQPFSASGSGKSSCGPFGFTGACYAQVLLEDSELATVVLPIGDYTLFARFSESLRWDGSKSTNPWGMIGSALTPSSPAVVETPEPRWTAAWLCGLLVMAVMRKRLTAAVAPPTP